MDNVYRILIVTGGYLDCDWAAQWLKEIKISYCIAADKGLMYIDKLGINVNYILGDYDSVDEVKLDEYKNDNHALQTGATSNHANIVTYPTEKDYTDTHLAMKRAIEILKERKVLKEKLSKEKEMLCEVETEKESLEIYILGGTGTRLDHTMTNIFCMNEVCEAGFDCYIMDKYNKIYICDNIHRIVKKKQYGSFVSILPITEEVILTLKGMKYNLDHFCLKQGVSICQSNEIADDVAQIIVKKGKVIVYETKD